LPRPHHCADHPAAQRAAEPQDIEPQGTERLYAKLPGATKPRRAYLLPEGVTDRLRWKTGPFSKREGAPMFDHVVFGVTDYAASKAFFLAALAPLGVTEFSEGPLGIEISGPPAAPGGSPASLCLAPAKEKPAPLHIAFAAATRAEVDAFHRAALAAGGTDNGAPGLRPQYHAHYYAAFVIAPDGHNIEAVCHKPEG
jgi:catechol 2,3-dioxygenase-like lactoylglutathione lyase family enzyme